MSTYFFIMTLFAGGMIFYGIYFIIEVIYVHKKLKEKHFYFAIACIITSSFIIFSILLTLNLTDEQYLLFHRIKWMAAYLNLSFISFVLYECYFPNAKKVIPITYLILTPIYIITSVSNDFISLPINIVHIKTFFIDITYHTGKQNILYQLNAIIIFLCVTLQIIHFLFSKKYPKGKPFLIIFIILIFCFVNDLLVNKRIYDNIFTIEIIFVATYTFVFFDFLKESRKTHLAVVNLSNELQKHKDELEIKVIERTKELSEEKEKVEDLLHNVLPFQIVKEYNETGLSKPVLNENATIVFTDFVSFSKFAEDNNPQLVVDNLDKIFSKFDDIVKSKNLEKLKTIGDSYMFAGGLFHATNQLEESLQSCFEMVEYIKNSKQVFINDTGYEWALRVGIHTGPVVTGLIGKWRFLYDTWGNTVNIASRLEGASETNRINTSRAVYDLLSENNIHPMTSSHRMNNNGKYNFEYRGTLPIKNMNPIEMYFVELRIEN